MAEKTRKITKREVFEALKGLVIATVDEGGKLDEDYDVTYEAALEILDNAIAQLDKRAEVAKARAAEKKAEGDVLRKEIYDVLTDEFQTAEEIAEVVGGEDVTKGKVVARMAQLVKAGQAVKALVKVNDETNRKVMQYKLAEVDTDAEDGVEPEEVTE